VEAAKKARRLDPRLFLRLDTVGQTYVHAGRYEEAIPVLKQVLTYNANYWPTYWGLAVSYSELGRGEEARAAGAEMLRIMPQFSVEKWKRMAPYKDPTVTERIAAALRKAGLK
jgi:adenylate cyclase